MKIRRACPVPLARSGGSEAEEENDHGQHDQELGRADVRHEARLRRDAGADEDGSTPGRSPAPCPAARCRITVAAWLSSQPVRAERTRGWENDGSWGPCLRPPRAPLQPSRGRLWRWNSDPLRGAAWRSSLCRSDSDGRLCCGLGGQGAAACTTAQCRRDDPERRVASGVRGLPRGQEQLRALCGVVLHRAGSQQPGQRDGCWPPRGHSPPWSRPKASGHMLRSSAQSVPDSTHLRARCAAADRRARVDGSARAHVGS